MTFIVLAVLALGQAGPGPLDAFRANYASINVEIEYVTSRASGDAEAIAGGALWRGEDIDLVPYPDSEVIGRWACDGHAEHYVFGSPPHVIQKAIDQPPVVSDGSKAKSKSSGLGMEAMMGGPHYVPRTEALYDGAVLASHRDVAENQGYFQSDTIYVWRDSPPGSAASSEGPFFWWGGLIAVPAQSANSICWDRPRPSAVGPWRPPGGSRGLPEIDG